MPATDSVQKLQQDLQNELTNANQLLRLISVELIKLKEFTAVGGELETNVKQNASLMVKLANLQHIDIANLPPVPRIQLDSGPQTDPNTSRQQDNSMYEWE